MSQNYEALKKIIASYQRLVVAFSGGVDSSFLLKTAHDVLGENVVAITAKTHVYRDWETDRKSTRLNSSHRSLSRMPSSA